MSEYVFQDDGLSATDIVDSYKPDMDVVWMEVFHPTNFTSSAKSLTDRKARKRQALDKAISVTTARNVAGLGRILQSAQQMVRVLFNQKTSELAYVIGPELMEEILAKQVLAMQEKIEERQMELEAKNDAFRAADARRSFFRLSNSFKPIDADVPIVKGTAPSKAIEF